MKKQELEKVYIMHNYDVENLTQYLAKQWYWPNLEGKLDKEISMMTDKLKHDTYQWINQQTDVSCKITADDIVDSDQYDGENAGEILAFIKRENSGIVPKIVVQDPGKRFSIQVPADNEIGWKELTFKPTDWVILDKKGYYYQISETTAESWREPVKS